MSHTLEIEDNLDRNVRANVLEKMEKEPANCELYEQLGQILSNTAGGSSDYGMGTHRLLATIHKPHCTNSKHLEAMAYLFGE